MEPCRCCYSLYDKTWVHGGGKQLVPSVIAGESADVTAMLDDSLVVSCRAKYTLTTASNSHTPWYLPK